MAGGAVEATGLLTSGTLNAFGAVGAVGAVEAVRAVGAVGAVDAVGALEALDAVGALETVDAVGALDTVDPAGAVGVFGTVGVFEAVDAVEATEGILNDRLIIGLFGTSPSSGDQLAGLDAVMAGLLPGGTSRAGCWGCLFCAVGLAVTGMATFGEGFGGRDADAGADAACWVSDDAAGRDTVVEAGFCASGGCSGTDAVCWGGASCCVPLLELLMLPRPGIPAGSAADEMDEIRSAMSFASAASEVNAGGR